MILTSGTLAPLGSFGAQLQVQFDYQLENPHVVKDEQVWLGVIKTGVTGKKLNSSYNFRNTIEYKQEIGNTIANFARVVPDGLLVFFPSYVVMSACIECWKKTGIERRISRFKEIIVEPRSSSEMKVSIRKYNELIAQGKGAIFLAVCRGKASEGIDFSNQKARAVIITGLPYPPKFDPKVYLKCQFLDAQKHDQKYSKLTGNTWYSQQATRAVNQAVGRVIRHRLDYGAIILCDERFSYESQRITLSKWLQDRWHVCSNFGEANKQLINFYRTLQTKPALNNFKVEQKNYDDLSDEDKSSTTKQWRKRPKGLTGLIGKKKARKEHVHLSYEACGTDNLRELYATPPDTNKSFKKPTATVGPFSKYTMSSSSKPITKQKPLSSASTLLPGPLIGASKQKNKDGPLTAAHYARQRMRKRKVLEAENKQTNQKSEMKKKPNAAQFLSSCKDQLNAKEYNAFKQVLVQLNKKQNTELTACLSQVVRIFSGKEREELRQGFYCFIPKNARDEYKDMLGSNPT